jgi:ABC-type dipeptide/oligopeptide/nickel transport system permease component
MIPSLLGITFLTFVLLDAAPIDRARMEVLQARDGGAPVDPKEREVALLRLQVRYGFLEEQTLQPVPVWERYGRWLGNALQMRLAGPEEDQARFWRRLGTAVPISVLLGLAALLSALGAGLPVGVWLGMRVGTRREEHASRTLFVLGGMPEVLIATLLLIGFGGVWLDWFPSGGLHSDGIERESSWGRATDLVWHIYLPVLSMTLPIYLMVARFVRDAVRQAASGPSADNLRAWGVEPRIFRWRMLRFGCAALAPLCGSLLPTVVAGSVVVETTFSIDGVGRLFWAAVTGQDHAMVMAIVLLTSLATLLSLAMADLLQRWADPRVRLT